MIDTSIPQLPQGFGQNSKSPFNIGGNVLSGLFGIGSALINANQQKKAHSRSIALMDRQFDMSKEMWKTQNAYNTPLKQMERLKQAGLNPALMYGQGNTGNANNAPQPTFNELTPFTSATDIAQSTASGVQMSLAGAQKQLLEANATKSSIEGAVKAGEYGIAKELSKYQMENMQASTNKFNQEIENLKSQKGLTDAKILSETTINALNKEYLKLEKQGFHKGNTIATLFKSIFGLNIKNKDDQMIAKSIIGTYLGSQVFGNLSGGLGKLLKGFLK